MITKIAALLLLSSAASAIVYGVDSRTLVSVDAYQKARDERFTKAIIRGYEPACGVGGEVDPNFVASYNNARAAGFTDIDTYWFPCDSSMHNCKSYTAQISEIAATIKEHNMVIGRIWIDLEKDSAVCNNWDYGFSGNIAQAHSLVNAIKDSGFNYGIYSSPDQWMTIFSSTSFVLDNALPLWLADYDNSDTFTLKDPFGGWTTASGHQYAESASGPFALNVFVS